MKEIKLMWLGNDGWIIDLMGTRIAFDLDLFLDIRLPLPDSIVPEELCREVDFYFITHAHTDHFNDETALMFAKKSDCRFIIAESCRKKAMELGMPVDRITFMSPGETQRIGDMTVTATPAIHGHLGGSVYSGASMQDCGYLINKKDFSLFQPGDTLLTQQHLEMGKVNLAFVSPTEHNMKVEQSLLYLKALSPDYILPQHYGSYIESPQDYFWSHGYTDELYDALPEEMKPRFIRLEQGKYHKIQITEETHA